MQRKLWLDDVRPAPDSTWFWAETIAEGQKFLLDNVVEECSLDHDLGHMILGDGELRSRPGGHFAHGDGVDFVRWMVANNLVPEKVTIHSWNPMGAREMARLLNDFGRDVVVAPFDPDERDGFRHRMGCRVFHLMGAGPCDCQDPDFDARRRAAWSVP